MRKTPAQRAQSRPPLTPQRKQAKEHTEDACSVVHKLCFLPYGYGTLVFLVLSQSPSSITFVSCLHHARKWVVDETERWSRQRPRHSMNVKEKCLCPWKQVNRAACVRSQACTGDLPLTTSISDASTNSHTAKTNGGKGRIQRHAQTGHLVQGIPRNLQGPTWSRHTKGSRYTENSTAEKAIGWKGAPNDRRACGSNHLYIVGIRGRAVWYIGSGGGTVGAGDNGRVGGWGRDAQRWLPARPGCTLLDCIRQISGIALKYAQRQKSSTCTILRSTLPFDESTLPMAFQPRQPAGRCDCSKPPPSQSEVTSRKQA